MFQYMKRKYMRIVHLCINGIVTDGYSYQDNLITRYQKRLGHEVTIITSRWIWNEKGELELSNKSDYFNEDSIRVFRLSMKGKEDYKRKFKRYADLYDVIEKCNPEILFIHGASCIDNMTIVKFVKRHPQTIVYVDNHTDLFNSGTNWISKNILHKVIWRHFAKKLIPYTKKFYGVSPSRVAFLTEMYGIPKEKCELLFLGADDEIVEEVSIKKNRNTIRIKQEILDSDFLIVTGGKINRFRPETLELMEAVISCNNPNIKLLIFGVVANDLKTKFEKLVRNNCIKYVGWVDSKSTYEYMAAADLVVFPGLHSVMWEQAVALGKPCIFKDIEGFHHVDIGGNVIFIKNISVNCLKESIEMLFSEPEVFNNMKLCAETDKKHQFLFSTIARKSIS